jgi:hypothetical protein
LGVNKPTHVIATSTRGPIASCGHSHGSATSNGITSPGTRREPSARGTAAAANVKPKTTSSVAVSQGSVSFSDELQRTPARSFGQQRAGAGKKI